MIVFSLYSLHATRAILIAVRETDLRKERGINEEIFHFALSGKVNISDTSINDACLFLADGRLH